MYYNIKNSSINYFKYIVKYYVMMYQITEDEEFILAEDKECI